MVLNIENIFILLRKKFPEKLLNTKITEQERNLANHLAEIIQECFDLDAEIEIVDDLTFDENAPDVPEFDDDDLDDGGEEEEEEESSEGDQTRNFDFFYLKIGNGGSSSSYEPSPKKPATSPGSFALVPYEEKKRALIHYREPKAGYRSLQSMHSRFRFIKTESDLAALRRLFLNIF
jgi:hypothetical protein